MSDTTNLVRTSRDGDQFHYFWASRRCLRLLAQRSGLVAITIEGSSRSEDSSGQRIDVGEEVIDVAEYYGSETLEHARAVHYIQLKHSTLHESSHWTASGLETTVKGFAERFGKLRDRFGTDTCIEKFRFRFVSNRPISTTVIETIADAHKGVAPRHAAELEKLERITGLGGSAFSEFCKTLQLDGEENGLWEQRNILVQDMQRYLAGPDIDAPIQLKELVTRKATSEFATNPTITRIDVLRALKTDEDRMFPANCLIESADNAVPREQEQGVVDKIIRAGNAPIVIHAEGGVGKSIFSRRIKLHLPKSSVAVLYDCFGNGQYRSASGYRHRHKDALVQVANELAGMGLCHPLIPTPQADTSDYAKAFLFRLEQSANSIRAISPTALLCVIIDAADNAQMAAQEINEPRSFVRDLLRERIPDGIRLVALCRTHRQNLLDPPPETIAIPLLPFSKDETSAHLKAYFPEANEHDVSEFHRLSSHNPRVQAMALSWKVSLQQTLRRLGPNPTTVEDAIGQILDDAIKRLRDAAGTVEKPQIDSICAGLAVLRPLIPISVLAAISGVHDSAIKSFATDLGRPLIVTGHYPILR